jgi:hypothetical protein
MIHVARVRDVEEIFKVAAARYAPWGRKILIELSKDQFHVSVPTIHVSKKAAGGNKDFRY